MSFRFCILSILAIYLLACGGGGGGGSSSSSSSNACSLIGSTARIINGQTCNADNSAIVRVAAVVQISGRAVPVPICTGTMISATSVLTAHHCFTPTQIDGFPVIGHGIVISEVANAKFFAASKVTTAPNYVLSNNRIFNDVAIMSLASAPGTAILPVLTSSSPSKGETGFVYGYGRRAEGTAVDANSDFSTLESGKMELQDVTDNHIFVIYDGSNSNVCNGDSGGPIIVERNGQPAIVGVVSQGTTVGCVPNDITTFSNLQSNELSGWLFSTVPDVSVY